jgi:hypothetical protein
MLRLLSAVAVAASRQLGGSDPHSWGHGHQGIRPALPGGCYQDRFGTLPDIASLLWRVYPTVVTGDASLANLCFRKRSLDARNMFMTGDWPDGIG